VRFLGIDFGRKRLGLALSDPTGTLARPWQVVAGRAEPVAAAAHIATVAATLRDDDDGLAGIIVGLPRRLDGSDNEQTASVRAFGGALAAATGVSVTFQDERLTSHEAEALLAEREPDWRVRKQKIDAAAAALILQDFLDARERARYVAASNDGGAR